MENKVLLDMKQIRKSFLGTEVLKGVDFSLHAGEIVSLVGTNGAGKSTLSNIAMGIHTLDKGEIYINGKLAHIESPKDAEDLGIGMVHQEPTLVGNMMVYENIFLNKEILKGKLKLDAAKMKQESTRLLNFIGFDIDVTAKVESLTLVQKEVVEIAKAMLTDPSILILDEVTAPLNLAEVEHLFQILTDLRTKGIGIIFIGHKIKELTQISDRIVVIRDGSNVGELDNKDRQVNEGEIIRLMLGETEGWHDEYSDKEVDHVSDEVLLHIEKLSQEGSFEDIGLDLHAGEIVGLAGLKGAGITELLLALFGVGGTDGGKVIKNGKEILVNNPSDAIKNGIGMITNDRQKEGLALTQSVRDNIVVSSLSNFKGGLGLLKTREIKNVANDYIKTLSVKTTGGGQLVQFLSGGNQQKVVIAKWLLRDMDVLLVDEPTRGVDVRAKNEIYDLLLEQRKQGKGILVTSPEIRELLNICDRIVVISHGKVVCEINRNETQFMESSMLEIVHSAH